MKYCPNCGNQLNDEVLFCEFCGTSQQTIPQFAVQQISQTMSQAPSIKTKKKRSKKPLIIAVISVLILALGVCLYIIIKNKQSEKQAIATLDSFFKAVNDFDTDEIISLCAEDKDDIYEYYSTKYQFYAERLGLYPGFYSLGDYMETNQEAYSCYLKGLGYKGDTFEQIKEEYENDIEGDAEIIFSGFKASYELKEIKKAEKCKFSYWKKSGYVEIDDIVENMEGRTDMKIDDIYVVRYNAYWEYNGNPYGDEKYLWDNYLTKGLNESYEDYIDHMNSGDSYAVIYKSDGKWYKYQSRIMANIFKIEM